MNEAKKQARITPEVIDAFSIAWREFTESELAISRANTVDLPGDLQEIVDAPTGRCACLYHRAETVDEQRADVDE